MLRRPVEGMRFRGLLGSGRGIRGVGLRAQDLRLGGLSMPFFWGGGGGLGLIRRRDGVSSFGDLRLCRSRENPQR